MGVGVRARERKKGKLEKRKEKKLLTSSQIVPYKSTLFTTLYVGQGQILSFFFFQGTHNRLK